MVGLSAAAYSLHKDAYKLISKSYFNDSVLCVRLAALKCVEKMISEKESPIFINCSIESIVILVLKSIYGSNYEVRHVAGKVISRLIERLIKTKDSSRSPESQSLKNVKDLMNLLDSIFIRGTVGGFLKTTSKRSTSLVNQRHIRIGLTIAYIEAARNLRSKWLDRNLQYWLKHLLELTEGLGQISFAALFFLILLRFFNLFILETQHRLLKFYLCVNVFNTSCIVVCMNSFLNHHK